MEPLQTPWPRNASRPRPTLGVDLDRVYRPNGIRKWERDGRATVRTPAPNLASD